MPGTHAQFQTSGSTPMRTFAPALIIASAFLSVPFPAQSEPKPETATVSEIDKLRAELAALQAKQAKEDANKKLVVDFYQQFFGDKDVSAADRYLLPSYIQHNPNAATGRDAVKAFFTPFFANPAIPKTKVDIKRVAADGDLVWLHLRSKTTGTDRAIVDIFRVENGKIAEHWDVVQQVPEKSANENTMF